jgi:CBS domain-containing protein
MSPSRSRSRRGASTVEVALVLLCVVGAGLVGWEMLGKRTSSALDAMAARVAGAPPDEAVFAARGAEAAERRDVTEDATPPADRALQAAAMVLGGLALCYCLLGRRAAPPASSKDDLEPAHDPAAESAAQARHLAKRQQIMRVVSKNREAVLTNRLAVQQVMTSQVAVVAPGTRVDVLQRSMRELRVRHLLVCRADGALLGVVSDRDLRSVAAGVAADCMTTNPLVVSPDTPLSPAVSLMLDRRISCLPVVAEGRLRGVLTFTDVVMTMQCLLQSWQQLGSDLRLAMGDELFDGVMNESLRSCSWRPDPHVAATLETPAEAGA